MNQGTGITVAILAALILLSAYFSATETAFSSLNRTRLKTLAEKGSRKARLALELSGRYDKLLSTILVGNNIVNIAASSLSTLLFIHLYGDVGATVSTVVITIVVLIFGEVTPKSIAKDCPERFAMFSAPIIRVLVWLLTPVNFLFSRWKALLARALKLKSERKLSQEELLTLVEEVQQDGSIDRDEGALLRNAITFSEREAEDILTHRVDLEAVPLQSTKQQLARVFDETKYSRLLVYEESIDHIIGVIHQKDFYTGAGVTELPLRELVTPVVYVLKHERISALLQLLQRQKTHVAVVLDEYGGTEGIVTMEDILEELVGEIWDEHDEVAERFRRTGPDTFLVDALADLDEFAAYFGLQPETEMVSLSGWVLEQLGHIPKPGDRFTFESLSVCVLCVENHRATELEIRRLSSSAAPAASGQ